MPLAPLGAHNLARPSLHRAAATACTTFDAEGTLAPIIGAIVGIIGQVCATGCCSYMLTAA